MKLEDSLYHLLLNVGNNLGASNKADVYQNVLERCLKYWNQTNKLKGLKPLSPSDIGKTRDNINVMITRIQTALNNLDYTEFVVSNKSKPVESDYDITISASKLCELLHISRPQTLIKNGLKYSKSGKLYSFKVKDVLIFIKNNHKYSMYYDEISEDFKIKV